MMTSSHEVTTRRSDVSKELYVIRQAAYAIDMIPWKGDPRKKPKLQTVQLALNAIKK